MRASGFNRLFSDVEYSYFLDDTTLSNVLILRAGAEADLTEKLRLELLASWFEVDDATSTNGNLLSVSFLSKRHARDLGIEAGITLRYAYSSALEICRWLCAFLSARGLG